MGRIRKVNEDAVYKTISFLHDLKDKIDNNKWFSATDLQERHNISKSTFSATKYFEIVVEKDGKFIWKKGEPSREMALLILEKLRVRQQKTAEPVKLPGFEDNIARIESLLTEIRDNAKVQQVLSNGLKTRDKPQTLFSDQEQRQRDRVYIAGQFLTVVFKDVKASTFTEQMMHEGNIGVITFTDDLLNKLYSK